MKYSSSSSSLSADADDADADVRNNTTYNNNNNKLINGGVIIRNKINGSSSTTRRPSNLPLLRRGLREYLLSFPNLKSLIPPPQPQPQPQVAEMGHDQNGGLVEVRGAAVLLELDPHDQCLQQMDSSSSWSSDEEMDLSTTTSSTTVAQPNKANFNQEDDDDDGGCYTNVEFEEDEEDASRPFRPSIKIRKMDDDSIYISTIVMKEVSLTSTLFGVLEEEKLDIVFEDQYRTETKAAHNIQVRVQPGYDVDALETKLCLWARCTT